MEDMGFEVAVDEDSDGESTYGSDEEQSQSPPRKRQKLEAQSISLFQTSDCHPVHARDKSHWNSYLKENPQIWAEKCQEWSQNLREAFLDREVLSCIFLIRVTL